MRREADHPLYQCEEHTIEKVNESRVRRFVYVSELHCHHYRECGRTRSSDRSTLRCFTRRIEPESTKVRLGDTSALRKDEQKCERSSSALPEERSGCTLPNIGPAWTVRNYYSSNRSCREETYGAVAVIVPETISFPDSHIAHSRAKVGESRYIKSGW